MDPPEAPASTPPPLPGTKPRPWGFWMTLLLSAVLYGVFTIAQVPVVIFMIVSWAISNGGADPTEYVESLPSDGFFLSLATSVAAPVCVAATWLLVRLRKGIGIRDYLALQPVRWSRLIGWLLLTAACAFAMDYVRTSLGDPAVPEPMLAWYKSARVLPLLWFAIVVAAPVFEEAVFRGFMYRGLAASRAGTGGAVLITALLWAALHLGQYDLLATASVLVLGLLMGIARAKTGSLYVPLAMHVLNNAVATVQISYTIAQSS